MADIRRTSPEGPPGRPEVRMKPGMSDELLKELAPLLAEDGVDINDVSDVDALNCALRKAVERRNTALFTPVGPRRRQAVALVTQVVVAIVEDDTELAGSLLATAQPESPDNSAAEVSSCIGLALGLLDDWLSGQAPDVPEDLARDVRLPPGHWFGERAAVNILALARKGRASASLGALITGQGSHHVQAGSALALAATVLAWSRAANTPVDTLVRTAIR